MGSLLPAPDPKPPVWDIRTYPDEAGFKRRTAAIIPNLARREVGAKCQAVSVCPDTGLPVHTFAVAGESIISPYTGRRYTQGDTGYFGPKERGEDGRITAFGGDPLKQDLPPAMARLLLHPDQPVIKAFLTVPGSLRQQYHFAAANWVRFYVLFADTMGEAWRRDFAHAVAVYTEGRRPSDGPRENNPLGHAHDLIGEVGELLGGRVLDGGTENHKTLWRTSGLLYAQLLGPDAVISGLPAPEAERRITPMLTGFWETILTVGNGEYDSPTYYPYSLRPYLNLFDLSPRPQTRALGQAMLDYYVAGYGLKVIGGVHAGAAKRGWTGEGDVLGEMDAHLWAWADRGVRVLVNTDTLVTSIHQATTKYRPNRVLYNIVTKNIPLPFEAQMARPSYHSKERNVFQESFYCDRSFALGSVALTQVDNPAQQTVWSLVCPHESGAFVLGGGQPRYRHPEGHSPYDQTLQKRGTLLLVTAPTRRADHPTPQMQARAENAAAPLTPVASPQPGDTAALAALWEAAPQSASTWLFVPRGVTEIVERAGGVYLRAGQAFVALRPLHPGVFWLDPDPAHLPDTREILRKYRVLVCPAGAGGASGYALDTAPASQYATLESFADAASYCPLAVTTVADAPQVSYQSLAGDSLVLHYNPTGLRADGTINHAPVDWSGWANGGVYASPYLTIKNGVMTVSDGTDTYTVRNDNGFPVWKQHPAG